MVVFGGGFVNALGHAFLRADLENQRKIKETWPEIYKKYSDRIW